MTPRTMIFRIGDMVALTPAGRRIAKRRKVTATTGRVVELYPGLYYDDVYVRRDGATAEWWPATAWRRL